MKIANLIEESRLGGPQIRMMRVSQELSKLNYSTTIFMPKANSKEFSNICKKKKITFETLDLSEIGITFNKVIKYLFFFVFDIYQIVKKLKLKNIDLIHISGGSWQIKGIVAGKILNIPTIWHINDTYMPKFIVNFYKLIYPMCTGLIYASYKSSKVYENFKSKPFAIIPSTLDTNFFHKKNSLINNLKINNDNIIVNVSNVSPVKNIETLILCIFEIKKKINNVHLLLIGNTFKSQKIYKNNILKLIQKLHLTESITFIGKKNDVRSYLKISDIYICSSNYESSPISIWEAMSMELPIISTDVGDLKKYIKNNHNGYITKKGDYITMSKRAIKIFSSPRLKDKFGKINRQIAIDNFSLDIISKKTISFYDKVHNHYYKKN